MKIKLQAAGVVLNLLTLAILATIYGAWLAYPLEIKWLGLENIVYMKAADISYNFNILMQYLTNPLQHVLSMPSFSSSDAGLHHFTQVKWLFHLAQGLFLCSLPALYFFWKEVIRKGFGSLFQKVFIWAALVPVLVALIGLLVGFEQFFILFHKILFVGDQTWLFDPNTDPVIYILPEEFFLHCFLLFFVLYEAFCGIMIFLTYVSRVFQPAGYDISNNF
ncbi:integral membrane protein (TIGR01906 family) [Streptococcus gallinaceus]|uniref:TIGR01906 family membrane protein n=1 Tax=Streptococcus gallinaceus TaxID=165758 RepID=UPI00209F40B8|nr:TIGR01906 family membrane protein [Streptococcus gallinaceus]MCP1638723.1 integral membrane protein (TIGR01906 family) [Streptococcus gallinaceus]MCP1769190.1 integral membrane protein (TIGR01906 family) [Streptococcus gallinaceus]